MLWRMRITAPKVFVLRRRWVYRRIYSNVWPFVSGNRFRKDHIIYACNPRCLSLCRTLNEFTGHTDTRLFPLCHQRYLHQPPPASFFIVEPSLSAMKSTALLSAVGSNPSLYIQNVLPILHLQNVNYFCPFHFYLFKIAACRKKSHNGEADDNTND